MAKKAHYRPTAGGMLQSRPKRDGFTVQDSLCRWVDGHAIHIAVTLVTLLSLLMRVSVLDFESTDYTGFLLPWYEESSLHGLASLSEPIGNYAPPYQALIALMTYVPVPPLVGYKVISIAFDYLLAVGGALLACRIAPRAGSYVPAMVYCLLVFWPAIAINSAMWAQCDSIWAAFCVFSILSLIDRKPALSMVFYGLALSFKLQAIFLLPLFLFASVRRSDFPIVYLGIVPLVMLATCLPATFMGRPMFDIAPVYFAQTDRHHAMYVNYPSFWALLDMLPKLVDYDSSEAYYYAMRSFAIALTASVIVAEVLLFVRYRVSFSPINTLRMAYMLTFTVVLFLPAMHERYIYLTEALGLILVVFDRKLILPFTACALTTLVTYGSFLFDQVITNYQQLAFVNVAGFAVVLWLLGRELSASAGTQRGRRALDGLANSGPPTE